MSTPRHNIEWSREELILALYLYCQIPFAKTKANNPEVQALANFLGRTPASIARKLGNFGAFDPLLASRGISGLTHFSKADKAVWEEFSDNWPALVSESQTLLNEEPIVHMDDGLTAEPISYYGKEGLSMRKVRVGQSFFRRSVLSSYNYKCCICDLDIRQLLVASHIVPWSVDANKRLNPDNGLSLCSLHDKAFDIGLISLTTDLVLVVSERIRATKSAFVKASLLDFEGSVINPPQRFRPASENIHWHRDFRFEG